jgi:hypothetical protein
LARTHHRALAGALIVASLFALPVHAAEPATWLYTPLHLGPASADSPGACAALADEQRRWQQHQPITELDVYRSMGDMYGALAYMQLAIWAPTVGLQVARGGERPGLTISWPGSIPLGPTTACRRSSGGDLDQLRTLRVVVEPGIVVDSAVSVFLRPGLRALWHRTTWRIGVGAGLGSTLSWGGGGRAASISPELILHVGRCCGPGYVLFSLRADRYTGHAPDTAVASLSLTYW